MPEALPFVQVGTPEQGFGGGLKGGRKGLDESADSQLFSNLMAQYAQASKAEEARDAAVSAAAPSKPLTGLEEGLPRLSPGVLELLASLRNSLRNEVPGAFELVESPGFAPLAELAKDVAGEVLGALPEESLRRLEALLSGFARRGAAGDDAALSDAMARAVRDLVSESDASAGLKAEGVFRQVPAALLALRGSAGTEPGGDEETSSSKSEDGVPRDDAPLPEAAGEAGASLPAFALLGAAVPGDGAERREAPEGRAGLENAFVLRQEARAPRLREVRTPSEEAVAPEVSASRPAPSGEGGENALKRPLADRGENEPVRDAGGERGAILRPNPDRMGEDGDRDRDDGASRRRARTAGDSSRMRSVEELPRSAERMDSRPDFQTFLDGIAASRRLAQSAAAPLELSRGTLPDPGTALREGLENVVRFARMNGEQRASLIVDPPALGRLTVELTSGAAGLEANIKVSSEQVRHLVQDQIVQLRMSLAQQGVQLAQFSVDVQQDDGRGRQGFGQGQGNRRRSRSGAAGEDDEAAGTVFRVDLNEGLLHWVG